jgi:putative ABC transport system substrate-binding protein
MAIEYRWADNQYDRLPGLVTELIRYPVAIILASGGPVAALAAKRETLTLPIVFPATSNPVELGLVSSLSRPGGNITGIAALTTDLDAKRLELLRDLVPPVERIGVLVNPNRPASNTQVREIEAAGRTLGRQLIILRAGSESTARIAPHCTPCTLGRGRRDAAAGTAVQLKKEGECAPLSMMLISPRSTLKSCGRSSMPV